MLLVAAELMQRVAPTTIFLLLFFVGVWHFLPSYFYSHMHTTKGYIWRGGVPGVLGVKRCFVLGILWNQTSHISFRSGYVWILAVVFALTLVHFVERLVQKFTFNVSVDCKWKRDSLNVTDVTHMCTLFYHAWKYQGLLLFSSVPCVIITSCLHKWNSLNTTENPTLSLLVGSALRFKMSRLYSREKENFHRIQ